MTVPLLLTCISLALCLLVMAAVQTRGYRREQRRDAIVDLLRDRPTGTPLLWIAQRLDRRVNDPVFHEDMEALERDGRISAMPEHDGTPPAPRRRYRFGPPPETSAERAGPLNPSMRETS